MTILHAFSTCLGPPEFKMLVATSNNDIAALKKKRARNHLLSKSSSTFPAIQRHGKSQRKISLRNTKLNSASNLVGGPPTPLALDSEGRDLSRS